MKLHGPTNMVDSWQARGNPLFTSHMDERPRSAEEAAVPGSERPLPSPAWGQRLPRTPSLDTPSERSAKERHSLERVLEQEGSVLLRKTPELRTRAVPLLVTATPQSEPEADEAASSPLGWSAHLAWTAAAEPRGAEGQREGPPARWAVHKGGEGLERAGVEEGPPSGDARGASRVRPPLAALEMSGRGEAPEGADEDAEEALLNSISLTQLYLGERFASGTYGRLYSGIFRGQDVAIKILRSPASEQEGADRSSLFRQEVKMLAQLDHPNIVQFHGACQKPPLHCLVSELLPGGTVRKYLSALRQPPPFLVALRMALDVARGMEYLHSKNIIHRDLKSDNLVLSRGHVVKLTDFGSARVESEQGAHMTAETGTFKFMAPEMIRRRAYSRKVDVYSFGILCWEMFTAEVAFAGMSGVQAAFAVVNKGLRPGLPPVLPPLLRNLLRSCWHPSPDRRPDFPTVVRILEALRQGPPPNGGPPVQVRRRPGSFRLLATCFSGGGAAGPPGGDESATSSDSSPSSASRGEPIFKLRARRQQG